MGYYPTENRLRAPAAARHAPFPARPAAQREDGENQQKLAGYPPGGREPQERGRRAAPLSEHVRALNWVASDAPDPFTSSPPDPGRRRPPCACGSKSMRGRAEAGTASFEFTRISFPEVSWPYRRALASWFGLTTEPSRAAPTNRPRDRDQDRICACICASVDGLGRASHRTGRGGGLAADGEAVREEVVDTLPRS